MKKKKKKAAETSDQRARFQSPGNYNDIRGVFQRALSIMYLSKPYQHRQKLCFYHKPKIRGKSDGSLRRFVDVGSRIMIIKNGCLLRAAITSHRLKFQTLFTRSEYHLDYLCFVTER